MTNYKLQITNFEFGQSLFELVVAIAISALIVVAIVSLTTNSIRNSSYSKNQSLAATYAQEASEWLRGQRDADPAVFFVNATKGSYCLNSLGDQIWLNSIACTSGTTINGTPFTRNLTFPGSCGTNSIEADVTVSWQDSQGFHEVTNATCLSDIRQK